MKLNALVAALALVAAGSANAAILPDGANGTSLIFEAWDSTTNMGMVQSLGTTMNGFLTGANSINMNLDAASFATLLGTDTAGTNLQWHIYSAMATPTTASGDGILTTIAPGGLPSAALDVFSLPTLELALGAHIGQDVLAVTGTANFGTMPSTNAAYGGLIGTDYLGNMPAGKSVKTGFGAIDFYSIASDTATNSVRVDTKLPGQFTLSADGNVTNVAASAVPLPAAAWLFGSGLLGLVGIGRRRNAA